MVTAPLKNPFPFDQIFYNHNPNHADLSGAIEEGNLSTIKKILKNEECFPPLVLKDKERVKILVVSLPPTYLPEDYFQFTLWNCKEFGPEKLKIALTLLKKYPDFAQNGRCLDFLLHRFGFYLSNTTKMDDPKLVRTKKLVCQIFRIFLENRATFEVPNFPNIPFSHSILHTVLNYPNASSILLPILEGYESNTKEFVKPILRNIGLPNELQSLIMNYFSIATVEIKHINQKMPIPNFFGKPPSDNPRGLTTIHSHENSTFLELANQHNIMAVPFLQRLNVTIP